jgi:RNA polymerase sigma factor (sigma-70 family)
VTPGMANSQSSAFFVSYLFGATFKNSSSARGGRMKQYSQKPARDRATGCPRFFDDAYPVIRRVAGVRAASVAKACGLSDDERADLEQDAALQVWRKLAVFDPNRSSLKTFIERIVANQMASAIRRLRALKRQAPPDVHLRTHVNCEADSVNLRIDVLRVLDGLRPDEQGICRMLADHSAVDVSRRAGISRATIYRIITHLRVVFTEAGLHKSLRRGAGC